MNKSPSDFLADIARDPDDLPRLVYADWLETQGDLRSELIRTQCESAESEPSIHKTALDRRTRELLHEHASQWRAEYAKALNEAIAERLDKAGFTLEDAGGMKVEIPKTSDFVRGMPETVQVSFDKKSKKHAKPEALALVMPLACAEQVELDVADGPFLKKHMPDLPELRRVKLRPAKRTKINGMMDWLEKKAPRLRALDVTGLALDEAQLERVTRSPLRVHVSKLGYRLTNDNSNTPDFFPACTHDAEYFTNLRSLTLVNDRDEIATETFFPDNVKMIEELKELKIDDPLMSEILGSYSSQFAYCLQSTPFYSLETLDLSNGMSRWLHGTSPEEEKTYPTYRDEIADALVDEARAEQWGNNSGMIASAIGGSTYMSHLKTFKFSRNQLSRAPEFLYNMGHWENFPELSTIELRDNALGQVEGNGALKSIGEWWKNFDKLQVLDLRGNFIETKEQVQPLFDAIMDGHFPEITDVIISDDPKNEAQQRVEEAIGRWNGTIPPEPEAGNASISEKKRSSGLDPSS